MNNDEVDGFFVLNLLANILQIASYNMNVKEVSNDEIMRMLELQNKEYLDLIRKDIDKLKVTLIGEEETDGSQRDSKEHQ